MTDGTTGSLKVAFIGLGVMGGPWRDISREPDTT